MSAASAATPAAAPSPALVLRWIARGILICITAFWIWFAAAESLSGTREWDPLGAAMTLLVMLIPLAVLYIAWRWELAGAYLLLAVTLLGAYLYFKNVQRMLLQGAGPRFMESLVGLSIFVLPFLIPAVLLLVKCRLDRRARLAAEGIEPSS